MVQTRNFKFPDHVLLASCHRKARINQRLNTTNIVFVSQIATLETAPRSMDDLAIRFSVACAVFPHFGINRFEALEAVQKRSMSIQNKQSH